MIRCAHSDTADPTTLTPHPRNPNTHPPEQVALLAHIIREQGWRHPIVASNHSGYIVMGHARHLAALALGEREVPIDRQDFDSDESELAQLLADNRIAELAEMDDDLLKAVLESLDTGEIDMDLTGFDQAALEKLLAPAMLPDIDDVPPPPKDPKTKLGDLWLLGEHRVLCGDATSNGDFDALMAGVKGAFSFTSPPYNAGSSAKLSGNMGSAKRADFYQEYNDDRNPAEWESMCSGAVSNMLSVSDAVVVNIQMLAGNKLSFVDWLHKWRNNLVDIAIWNKGHAAPHVAESVMASTFEFLVVLSPKNNPSKAIPTAKFRAVQSVYDGPPQHDNEYSAIHGATFPVHLPSWAIKTLSTNQVVVDPFLGTGTTLIACEQLGRTCYGIELDPAYCDVIVERWETLTGKKAVLDA